MSSLVGKAKDNDDSFWGHSTWAEGAGGSDEESGASSFHQSDEDEEDRVDRFDSDFDNTEDEGDEEAEEVEAADREVEMRKDEKRARQRGKKGLGYNDIVSAGRELMQKKKGSAKRKKALMGEGINAGLVLNFPGMQTSASGGKRTPGGVVPPAPMLTGSAHPVPPKIPTSTAASTAKKKSLIDGSQSNVVKRGLRVAPTETSHAPFSRRSLRAATVSKSIETAHSVRQAEKRTAKRQAEIRTRLTKNPARKRYTQEELLIEGVNITEPENKRWILGRKRIMDQEQAANEDLYGRKGARGGVAGGDGRKVIMKFHSRRGCYNTLTFPEMDWVPEVLVRKRKRASTGINDATNKVEVNENNGQKSHACRSNFRTCVITGKTARYRCPKTLLGYHDLVAFKELRRRYNAGELLDQMNVAVKAEPSLLELENVANVIRQSPLKFQLQSKDRTGKTNCVSSVNENGGIKRFTTADKIMYTKPSIPMAGSKVVYTAKQICVSVKGVLIRDDSSDTLMPGMGTSKEKAKAPAVRSRLVALIPVISAEPVPNSTPSIDISIGTSVLSSHPGSVSSKAKSNMTTNFGKMTTSALRGGVTVTSDIGPMSSELASQDTTTNYTTGMWAKDTNVMNSGQGAVLQQVKVTHVPPKHVAPSAMENSAELVEEVPSFDPAATPLVANIKSKGPDRTLSSKELAPRITVDVLDETRPLLKFGKGVDPLSNNSTSLHTAVLPSGASNKEKATMKILKTNVAVPVELAASGTSTSSAAQSTIVASSSVLPSNVATTVALNSKSKSPAKRAVVLPSTSAILPPVPGRTSAKVVTVRVHLPPNPPLKETHIAIAANQKHGVNLLTALPSSSPSAMSNKAAHALPTPPTGRPLPTLSAAPSANSPGTSILVANTFQTLGMQDDGRFLSTLPTSTTPPSQQKDSLGALVANALSVYSRMRTAERTAAGDVPKK